MAGIADLAPPGLNRVFFSTGGSIANETAVRTAHHYFRLQGRDSKRFVLSVDQVVPRFHLPGGWGNPFERDPALVANDVRNGFVSVEAAERDYGVAVDPATFSVDTARTATLRG